MQIQEVVTAPRSPWQNAYAERFIGSIRRECLDHVIVLSAAGLQRLVRDYVAYYLRSRTHLLDRDSRTPRPVMSPSAGRVVTVPDVNGLHHRYDRVAAYSRRPRCRQPNRSCKGITRPALPLRKRARRIT